VTGYWAYGGATTVFVLLGCADMQPQGCRKSGGRTHEAILAHASQEA
jgi:hypothetical protein